MKKFTVDKIEEEKAVLECENGKFVTLELKSLPKNIKEGDVLEFADNSYFLDEKETEIRREKIRGIMDKLFND